MRISIIFLLLLFGCSVGSKYRLPIITASKEWKNKKDETVIKQAPKLWWHIFNDQTLNNLEDIAVRGNFDLKVAKERVCKAKAYKDAIASRLYPQINLDPGYDSLLYYKESTGGTLKRFHERAYILPLVMNWEIDIFERIQSEVNAACYSVEKFEELKRDVLLIITTDVAISYYNIRIRDKELEILNRSLKRFESDYKIVEARYNSKISNYSDVTRAGLLISSTEALIEETKRKREVFVNLLATLLATPASCFSFAYNPINGLPPQVPSGIPADILKQRPDVRAMEKLRLQRHFDINAAEAAFYPSLTLTGGLGSSSPVFKDFLKWISRWILWGANASQVVYDGGYLCAELQQATAQFKEADYEYKQILLKSFQEVETSLSDIERYTKEYEKVKESFRWANNTYEIADVRYINGFTFYLDVTEAQDRALNAELLVADTLGMQFISTVELIKALGGSWQTP
jgi:multidrug efflux system outer membrane protein